MAKNDRKELAEERKKMAQTQEFKDLFNRFSTDQYIRTKVCERKLAEEKMDILSPVLFKTEESMKNMESFFDYMLREIRLNRENKTLKPFKSIYNKCIEETNLSSPYTTFFKSSFNRGFNHWRAWRAIWAMEEKEWDDPSNDEIEDQRFDEDIEDFDQQSKGWWESI